MGACMTVWRLIDLSVARSSPCPFSSIIFSSEKQGGVSGSGCRGFYRWVSWSSRN